MKKYEYRFDTINIHEPILEQNNLLDKRSSVGWEMVSTVSYKVGSGELIRIYWKREVK